MNSDFYNKVFTENEKKLINSSNLSDVGITDNVFLLSNEEAEKYFANDDVRRCKATEYAVKNGAYVTKNGAYVTDNGYCNWWLRSPYPNYSFYVCSVGRDDGVIRYNSFLNDEIAVRPALWINL